MRAVAWLSTIASSMVVLVMLQSLEVDACCECKCRTVLNNIEEMAFAGCHHGERIPFVKQPTYFVERLGCDGQCPTGRVLGFFRDGSTIWGDAWVDERALGSSFQCTGNDKRCTVWSPTHCPTGEDDANRNKQLNATDLDPNTKQAASTVSDVTGKGNTDDAHETASIVKPLQNEQRGVQRSGSACPAGTKAKTCKYTGRPCTLRCLLKEKNVCDDRHHFCNFLEHGQLYCASKDCGDGFYGGGAPGIQEHATILIADTEDF